MSFLAASTGYAVAFYLLSALAIASALLMVIQKHAVGSVLWLVVTFVGLAGLFVLMQAYFLAVVQVLVYAGAIMVLFLFVIMLLDLRPGGSIKIALPRLPLVGLSAVVLFLVTLIAVVAAVEPWLEGASMVDLTAAAALVSGNDSVREIGIPLFASWILPFEVTSVLLLAAIIGSVALTQKKL